MYGTEDGLLVPDGRIFPCRRTSHSTVESKEMKKEECKRNDRTKKTGKEEKGKKEKKRGKETGRVGCAETERG